MMMRRDAFSLVDQLYPWAQAMACAVEAKEPQRFSRLSHAAVDEILVLGALAPLLGTNVRAGFGPELFCTDASGSSLGQSRPGRAGVCRADVPRRVVRDLWRFRIRRGGAQMLDDQALLDVKAVRQSFFRLGASPELLDELYWTDFEHGQDLHILTTREWFAEIVRRLDWRAGAFGVDLPADHVNLLEMKALRILVRRLIREGWRSRRVLVGVDSNVVIGAVAKGRSGSRRLRRLQQALVAEVLFADLYVGCLPVASLENPSDDPSRRVKVRAPREQPWGWADAYLAGMLTAIDEALGPDSREYWLRPLYGKPGPGLPRDEWEAPHAVWEAERRLAAAAEAERSERAEEREKRAWLARERVKRRGIARQIARRGPLDLTALPDIPEEAEGPWDQASVASGDSAYGSTSSARPEAGRSSCGGSDA